MKARHVMIMLLVMSWPLCAHAQSRVITGRVTDSTGAPVPLMRVFLSSRSGNPVSGAGTLTDRSGRYRLEVTGDSGYLAVRRVGFAAVPPRPIPRAPKDSVTINWTVRALAVVMPPVFVSTGECAPIDSYPSTHPTRQLWDRAVEVITARQAFLDLYQYEERFVRTELKQGMAERVTDDSSALILPPQPLIEPSFRSDPLGQTWEENRMQITKFWAPLDAALIDSVFVRRFCFDNGLTSSEDGEFIQLNFREPGRARDSVIAKGVLQFRADVQGLATMIFTYEKAGKVIGRGSVGFTNTPVEGTAFPLETKSYLEHIDPGTKAVLSRVVTERSYSKFLRVPTGNPPAKQQQ